MSIRLLLFLFLTLPLQGYSQRHTISGRVVDSTGSEPLISATVIDGITRQGTVSNEYGFYSLTLPEGRVELRYSYVGYKTRSHAFYLDSDTTLHIALRPGKQIGQVTITRDRSRQLLRSAQTSMIRLQPEAVEKMPVILGEPDLIKTVQLLPGIQRGHEGFSGMHVRGGNSDQNLILLDGVPVYNVNHLFGMFSVFHPSAIKDVKLYKGGFPARYQGRVSSVMDVRMKEGNMKKLQGQGSIGLVASRLSLEGPIKKDTASFIVSGRRTYIDLLAKPLIMQNLEGERGGYYFYDATGKANWRFSEKSRLFLSGYLGRDRFYHKSEDTWTYENTVHDLKTRNRLGWGNITGLLRWNYRLSDKLFLNTSFSYSRFRFRTGVKSREAFGDSTLNYHYNYTSGVTNLTADMDFDYVPGPDHYVRFGLEGTRHLFNPGVSVNARSNYMAGTLDTTYSQGKIPGTELSAYIEDDWKVTPRIRIHAGLNYNLYHVQGKSYSNFEPRLSTRYLVNDRFSVKASWGLMNQYLHLLTNSSVGLPTDLWLPVTEDIQPIHSSQYTIGGFYQLNDQVRITLEGYYKDMQNLIEYREGAGFLSETTGWQEKVTTGSGRSYGAELFVEKTGGRTTGWISYTLSRAERTFTDLNFGEPFPFKYDRRHVFNLTMNHRFTDNLSLNVTWVYNTGRAATFETQEFASFDVIEGRGRGGINYYPYRNNLRFPDYHRLDVGVNMKKQTGWGVRTWRVGLYNAYSRINPFYLRVNLQGNLEKVGLFPIMPFVSYQFIF